MSTQVQSGPPVSARPTGTVTFLFSDVEGSTERWERAPQAMALALARHDRLVRAAVEANAGYVFKTVGDAFCAAFANAAQAVAAAMEAQRALAGEDFSDVDGLRVRMALHSGISEERDGDYFGPTLNRVARLLAIGHGGQVLLSRVCAELANSSMAQECDFRDLGAHRLKDLAQTEHVYQLLVPDLADEFPALLSLDRLSHNLPAQLTSFVGREEVMHEIKALLERHRLVTLAGTGGSGKTRCAIQVGAELLNASDDGVWLAEFAPISDPSLVAGAVVRALNVQGPPSRPALDTLLGYLKNKRLLLILDNCEHVIDEVRPLVVSILKSCPGVRVLATSREALNVEGEQRYRMPSLAVPPAHREISPKEMIAFGAPLLFADRAFSVDSRFRLTEENLPHVAEICRRLDGIPLAIELAAARVKVLSPNQLARMLEERFRLLTGGSRTALPRQQTMRALIDWSYDLLSDEERALFRKLSVFAGGFTLEAAAAVCCDSDTDEIGVLDLLSSLVDKSLVQSEESLNGTRYRLLESTRQYARERLAEHGDEDLVARAHANAFLAFAEDVDRAWEITSDREWFAKVAPEIENFRAALHWALESRGDVLLGQRLAGALPQAWWSLGSAEGRRWVQAARALIDEETPAAVIAGLELTEAELAASLGEYAASRAAGERAAAHYTQLADRVRGAYARRYVGTALVFLGEIEQAETLLVSVLNEGRALEAHRLTALTLQTLADARHSAGDVEGARHHHAEALALMRSIGAERAAASLCINLAEAEFHGGDASEALRLAQEALDAHRALNATRGVAFAMVNIAAYQTALERYEEALESARAALTAVRDAQFEVGLAWGLQHLAAIAALRSSMDEDRLRDDFVRAAQLLGYADARLSAVGSLREFTERTEYEKVLAVLHESLGEDRVAELMREGSLWNEDRAVAEAMLI